MHVGMSDTEERGLACPSVPVGGAELWWWTTSNLLEIIISVLSKYRNILSRLLFRVRGLANAFCSSALWTTSQCGARILGPRRPFFKSCVFLPPTRRRAPPPPPRRRSPLAKCFSLSHPTPFVKGVPPRLTKNMQSTEGLHKIPTAAVGYSDFLIRRQCLSLSLSRAGNPGHFVRHYYCTSILTNTRLSSRPHTRARVLCHMAWAFSIGSFYPLPQASRASPLLSLPHGVTLSPLICEE